MDEFGGNLMDILASMPLTMMSQGGPGWNMSPTGYDIYSTKEDGTVTHHLDVNVAPYAEDSIGVYTEGRTLRITADMHPVDPAATCVHAGFRFLGARGNLNLAFDLDEHVEVSEASVAGGVLSVNLIRDIPEGQKRRQIEIKGASRPKESA